MFGGLHIEMAALRSIGTLLKDSGWTGALFEARVAFSGMAESFLSASGVTRTRQAHQITAYSLPKLIKAVYTNHCAAEVDENPRGVITFVDWCMGCKQESPLILVPDCCRWNW